MINEKSVQYIALSSITYAQKAKDILNKHGVKAHIIKTPREFSSCGCGFSVSVNGNAYELESLLRNYGIKVVGVYP